MRQITVYVPRPHVALRARRVPRRTLVGLAVGAVAAAAAFQLSHAVRPRPGALTAAIAVTSVPSGADVQVDGASHGRTPTRIAVHPGVHRVTLRHPDAIDWVQTVQAMVGQNAALAVTLWRRSPSVEPLRPPFPGATIADAAFLPKGRLALRVTLPPGTDHTLWLRDSSGHLAPLGPAVVPGAIVAAPDGQTAAYLAPAAESGSAGESSGSRRLTALWIAPADGHSAVCRYRIPAIDAASELVDVRWSPNGAQLLVAEVRRLADGGVRTRLLRLDARTWRSSTTIELPSSIIPGSIQWSPHSDQAALLARAGDLTSLCLLGVSPPGFRYLADLQHGDVVPPFSPLAWAPDGARAVYAAPLAAASQTLAGALFGSHTASGLFLIDSAATEGRRLGAAIGDWPVWLPDGQVLAVTPADGQGKATFSAIDIATSTAHRQGQLPLPAPPAGLRWDAVQGRAIAARRQDGGFDYSLLTFLPEAS